jgi:hypothetical protein
VLSEVHLPGQLTQVSFGQLALHQDRDGRNTEASKYLQSVVPGQAFVVLVPDGKAHEVGWQTGVAQGMTRIQVFSADAPAHGNVVSKTRVKLCEPVPRRMVPAVDGTGVKTRCVQGGVLPVHFLRHQHRTRKKCLSRGEHLIVAGDPLGPGQMKGARMLDAHDELRLFN